MDGRENDLGSRRSNVDSNGGERNIIAQPNWIIFQQTGINIIVIMVRITIMIMRIKVTEHVIINRVGAYFFFLGQSSIPLCGPSIH